MQRVLFSSISAFALITGLPFINHISLLTPIQSANISVAQTPQRQKPIQVRLEGEKQVVTKDGKSWEALKGKTKSGDVLRYTIIAENKSDRTIKNLALNGPIPKGTILVLQSVQAPKDAQITYSIDGGKTFVANPTITVKVNGKTETKPAPANSYTNIRVKLPVVAAKSTIKTTYETQVR